MALSAALISFERSRETGGGDEIRPSHKALVRRRECCKMSPRASSSSACVRKATVTANDDRPTDPRIGLQKMALNVKNDGGWRDPRQRGQIFAFRP